MTNGTDSPPTSRSAPLPKVTEEKLSDYLRELVTSEGSYSNVADRLGVSKALIWRAVNEGYIPKRNDLRKKLGLPEIIVSKKYRDPESGKFTGK